MCYVVLKKTQKEMYGSVLKVTCQEDFDLKHKDTKSKTPLKRQRSENWNDFDKELLKDLIKIRVKEIENKNTDTNTNQMKKKAWLDIERHFNRLCSCEKRTVCQLKSQWTSIKIQAKKEIAEIRIEDKQTGAGQLTTEVPLSGSDVSVRLPNEFVIDTNDYDSDFLFKKNQEENSESCDAIVQFPSQTEKAAKDLKKQKAESETKISPFRKKNIASEKIKVADERIIKIDCSNGVCRNELHVLQIEVEKKKLRNLDLEFEVLQTKLNFYKKKSFNNIAT